MTDRVVLIETLWNVKGKASDGTEMHDAVLIETLWNVKKKVERYIRCRKWY